MSIEDLVPFGKWLFARRSGDGAVAPGGRSRAEARSGSSAELVTAREHPEVEQHLESDRVDLVLRWGAARAFGEFKFYDQRPRIDPYSGAQPHLKSTAAL